MRALITLATPSMYVKVNSSLKFLGLPMIGFAYFAPVLQKGYPSIPSLPTPAGIIVAVQLFVT